MTMKTLFMDDTRSLCTEGSSTLESEIFPQWVRDVDEGRRNRKIRVWSAGCSTGQEPYSLAMMLLAHFPAAAGWEIEIIATDLSTRVLSVAKKGIWPAKGASEIP